MNSQDEVRKLIDEAAQFIRREVEVNGPIILADGPEERKEKLPAENGPARQEPHPAEKIPIANTRVGIRAGVTSPSYPDEPWVSSASLGELNANICTCTRCGLGSTRKNFVFGVGNPNADVVLIGEAPGADEDEKGEPFVGRAGQLLNKIIGAVAFEREEVFICNILKCRPPNNRPPAPDEVEQCEPHLWKQLELIKPLLILCLGRVAGQALLKTNSSLTNLRGKWHDYRGIPTMVTYHPAALLRNPNWKRPTWEDVQQFRKRYDDLKASGVPHG